MKCHECQAQNREIVNYCEDCGAKIASACPRCGFTISLGKRFCGRCGIKLSRTKITALDKSVI